MKENGAPLKIKFEHGTTRKTLSFKSKSTDYLDLLLRIKTSFELGTNLILIGCFHSKDKLVVDIEDVALNLEKFNLCKLTLLVKSSMSFPLQIKFFEFNYDIEQLMANEKVNIIASVRNVDDVRAIEFLSTEKINFYYKIDLKVSFGFVAGERVAIDLSIELVNDIIFKFESEQVLRDYFGNTVNLQKEFSSYFKHRDFSLHKIIEAEMFNRPKFCSFLQANFVLFYRGLLRMDAFRARLAYLVNNFLDLRSPNLSTSFSKDVNKLEVFPGKLMISEIQMMQQVKPHSDICLPVTSNHANNQLGVYPQGNNLYKSDSRYSAKEESSHNGFESMQNFGTNKQSFVSNSIKEAPTKMVPLKKQSNVSKPQTGLGDSGSNHNNSNLSRAVTETLEKKMKTNDQVETQSLPSKKLDDLKEENDAQKSTTNQLNSNSQQSNGENLFSKPTKDKDTPLIVSTKILRNIVTSLAKDLMLDGVYEIDTVVKYIEQNPGLFNDALQLYIKTQSSEQFRNILTQQGLMGELEGIKYITLNPKNLGDRRKLSLTTCRDLINRIKDLQLLPQVIVYEIYHLLLQKSVLILGVFECTLANDDLGDFAETASMIYEFFYKKNMLHFSTEYSKCIFHYNDFELLMNDQFKIVKKFAADLDDKTISALKASINSRKLWVYYVYQDYCRSHNYEKFIENLKKINETRCAKFSAKENSLVNIRRFLSEQKEYKDKLDLLRKITSDPQNDLKFSLFEYQIIMKDPSLFGIIEVYNLTKIKDDLIESLKIYQAIVKKEVPLGTIINVLVKNQIKEHQVC